MTRIAHIFFIAMGIVSAPVSISQAGTIDECKESRRVAQVLCNYIGPGIGDGAAAACFGAQMNILIYCNH